MVTPLEEVPAHPQLSLRDACVLAGDALHDLSERDLSDLDQQMNVVGHPTVGMHSRAIPVDGFAHQTIEHRPMRGCEKELLAVIASHGHVIKATWIMQPGSARHLAIP